MCVGQISVCPSCYNRHNLDFSLGMLLLVHGHESRIFIVFVLCFVKLDREVSAASWAMSMKDLTWL